MSEFTCSVVRATIVAHPNADAIEICQIGDYQSIVKKGMVKTGDLVVYIPEQAILPEWLMKEMSLWDEASQRGLLAGGARNRVKAIKLRGIVSQGLVLPTEPYSDTEVLVMSTPVDNNQGAGIVAIGGDAAECLGIIKYEPTLPSHMMGRLIGVDLSATHGYDFDNLKKFPNLFDDGEIVVISEKIHGTLLQVSVVPTDSANERYYQGRVVITSKGMGAKGWILDHDDESNLYAQAVKKHGLMDKALATLGPMADRHNKPVILFGEVFGLTAGGGVIQDLTYTGIALDYRAFDIAVGNRGGEFFLDADDFLDTCKLMEVPMVPVLWNGPYSKEVVLEHTDGCTTLFPAGVYPGKPQIREGVVVKAFYEDPKSFKRKIAKSVSNAYLLRKSENATEYS